MSENNIHFSLSTESKEEKYIQLIPQLKALLGGETDWIANCANLCAVLKEQFGWWWVGFYFVKDNALVLGPFQGPVACTRIARGKGVCGTAWQRAETIVVPNVHNFPGHIACSAASNSEIVLPLIQNGEVSAVLDIDSVHFNDFDETDARYLSQILEILILNQNS